MKYEQIDHTWYELWGDYSNTGRDDGWHIHTMTQLPEEGGPIVPRHTKYSSACKERDRLIVEYGIKTAVIKVTREIRCDY